MVIIYSYDKTFHDECDITELEKFSVDVLDIKEKIFTWYLRKPSEKGKLP